MSNKVYKRGIENLEPGQLIVIKFPGAMDDTFDSNRDTEKKQQKLKDYISNTQCLPAVILKKKYVSGKHGGVLYDVGFISRWIKGGCLSGLITLKDVPIWRYFARKEEEPIEGVPPNWLIEGIKENKEGDYFDSLMDFELFYVVDSDYVDEEGNSDYVKRIYIKKSIIEEE